MAGGVLGLLYIIWLLNLYNFMDGIDGLAAAQTLCVALGGAALYSVLGHTQLIWLPLLLAGSVTGFLIWNFPCKNIHGRRWQRLSGHYPGRVQPACRSY
ncbi:hypothetical protein [Neopusillimonas aromaticivorans]|uniref:hypothetical protein n=1 Tax=Neopusillimonas aromaticivorans TaxID=2979868 RepID=UPI0033151837